MAESGQKLHESDIANASEASAEDMAKNVYDPKSNFDFIHGDTDPIDTHSDGADSDPDIASSDDDANVVEYMNAGAEDHFDDSGSDGVDGFVEGSISDSTYPDSNDEDEENESDDTDGEDNNVNAIYTCLANEDAIWAERRLRRRSPVCTNNSCAST